MTHKLFEFLTPAIFFFQRAPVPLWKVIMKISWRKLFMQCSPLQGTQWLAMPSVPFESKTSLSHSMGLSRSRRTPTHSGCQCPRSRSQIQGLALALQIPHPCLSPASALSRATAWWTRLCLRSSGASQSLFGPTWCKDPSHWGFLVRLSDFNSSQKWDCFAHNNDSFLLNESREWRIDRDCTQVPWEITQSKTLMF